MSLQLQQPLLHHVLGKRRVPTPPQILGAALKKWHKARDPLMSLNGSNVAGWPCLVNNGSLTQGTASLQPVYSATGFNGGPGVTGSTTRWIKGTLTTAIGNATRITVWIVFKFGSDNGKTVFSLSGTSGAAEIHNIGNTNMIGNMNISTGIDAITGPAKDTNIHLGRLTLRSTTNDKFRIDDASFDGTGTGAANSSQNLLSLFSDNGSRIGNSSIAEIAISDEVPSGAQDTAMRTYFKTHPDNLYYGLTLTP